MTAFGVEKSVSLCDEDYEKIRRYTQKDFDRDELFVFNVNLCSNDIDRDYEKFSLSALNEMKSLFEGKTGIFDHSMKSSDQIARIFDTRVEKQEGCKTADGEDLYFLKAKAYMVKSDDNAGIIRDIEAGIKKEVSVSCSMKSRVCSVCGKDSRASGCGHIAGKVYGSKQCYYTLSDAGDAYEWSFVAVPAQRNAGVTKSFHIKGDEALESIIKAIKSADGDLTITKSQSREIADYITCLEEDSQIAGQYRDELVKEVTRLFCRALPKVETKLFSSLVGVMTAKELISFRDSLQKSEDSVPPKPQLAGKATKNQIKNSQFRI